MSPPLRASILLTLILAATLAAQTPPSYEEVQEIFTEARTPVARLEALSQANADSPWPRHFLGLAHQEARDLDAARTALEHARRLDPAEPFHVKALADLAWLAGQPERAARLYRTAERMEARPDVKKWLRGRAEECERILEDEDAGLSRARTGFWAVIFAALAGMWWLRPRKG